MSFLRTTTFLFVSLCLNQYSKAQGVTVSVDYTDINVAGLYHSAVSGSPYLSESWEKGIVKLQNGAAYSGILLKYDQLHNQLIFMNTDINKTQTFTLPVLEFVIGYKVADNYRIEKKYINGSTLNGAESSFFYELLTDGKYKLFKRVTKSIVEERSDNSILKTKQIKEKVSYYISSPTSFTLIKKMDKKSILSMLDGDSFKLTIFVDENKLNLKTESGLITLFQYYNSQ